MAGDGRAFAEVAPAHVLEQGLAAGCRAQSEDGAPRPADLVAGDMAPMMQVAMPPA